MSGSASSEQPKFKQPTQACFLAFKAAYRSAWNILTCFQHDKAACSAALQTCAWCRRNGRFTGFPVLGVKWQRMESAGLRSAYGLDPPRKGVLVRSIWPTSPVSKEVRPDDIIMRFDGVDIACDGTVPFRYASCQPVCRAATVPCQGRLCDCMYRNVAPASMVPVPALWHKMLHLAGVR